MAELLMFLGGSSSGKSMCSEESVITIEKETGYPVVYLATGTVWDEEFAVRVERHRERRPRRWKTVEEAIDLSKALLQMEANPVICLVDGIGTWMSNLLLKYWEEDIRWNEEKENQCLETVRNFVGTVKTMEGYVVVVADEVGMGVVPEYALGRTFRDLNGRANQILARAASSVIWVAAGIPISLKGRAVYE